MADTTDLGEVYEPHKAAREIAHAVMNMRGEMAYDGPVSIYVVDEGTLTLRVDSDDHLNPFEEYDTYGTLHWPRGEQGRPSGVDGAGCKLDTRQGPVWWQPPADEKGNEDLRERVQAYLREHWGYVVLTLEMNYGDGETYGTSLGGVETDCGTEYLEELIQQMHGEIPTAEQMQDRALADRLTRWALAISEIMPEDTTSDVDAHAALAEMQALAAALRGEVTA